MTTELVSLAASESGAEEATSLMSDDFVLGDYAWSNRELLIDGVRTNDPGAVYHARTVEVPLRGGGLLVLEREGDVFRMRGAVGEASEPGSGVAVRLSDEGITLLSSEQDQVGLLVRVSGLEDLPETNRGLIAALAIDMLTASVEQRDTADPVTIAIVIAVVGGVLGLAAIGSWATICGATVGLCMARHDEWDAKCGGVNLSYNGRDLKVKLGGGFSCTAR